MSHKILLIKLVLLFIPISTFSYLEVSFSVWQNDLPLALKGSTLEFSDTPLKNHYFEIKNAPSSYLPDNDGCYCFPIDSQEFSYSHLYYYLSFYYQELNHLLKKFGYQKLAGTKIRLNWLPNNQPSGSAGNGSILFNLPHTTIDPTVISHEIGHELHTHLSGDFISTISNLYKKKKWDQLTAWLLVMEGTANFISSVLNLDPRIGRYDYFEAAIDIDSYIKFPDKIVTQQDKWRIMVNSYSFAAKYPESVKLAQEQLLKPPFPELLDLPDPYYSSAAINQPLWHAMKLYGRDKIIQIYFKALDDWQKIEKYSDFAKRIILVTENKNITLFLSREFRKRGLL